MNLALFLALGSLALVYGEYKVTYVLDDFQGEYSYLRADSQTFMKDNLTWSTHSAETVPGKARDQLVYYRTGWEESTIDAGSWTHRSTHDKLEEGESWAALQYDGPDQSELLTPYGLGCFDLTKRGAEGFILTQVGGTGHFEITVHAHSAKSMSVILPIQTKSTIYASFSMFQGDQVDLKCVGAVTLKHVGAYGHVGSLSEGSYIAPPSNEPPSVMEVIGLVCVGLLVCVVAVGIVCVIGYVEGRTQNPVPVPKKPLNPVARKIASSAGKAASVSNPTNPTAASPAPSPSVVA